MNLPAKRHWTIHREQDRIVPGWIVTAPNGRRRWCFSWSFAIFMLPLWQIEYQFAEWDQCCPHAF